MSAVSKTGRPLKPVTDDQRHCIATLAATDHTVNAIHRLSGIGVRVIRRELAHPDTQQLIAQKRLQINAMKVAR